MLTKIHSRWLALLAASFGVAGSGAALAQGAYPNKPIRILVGFAPGGPSDIIARVVGAKMGEIMGAQFIVENKTGAGGAIATQEVARSAPDGYTLLNTPVATVANEFLSKTIKYEFGKDIIAVGPQAETANILVVHPSLGVKTRGRTGQARQGEARRACSTPPPAAARRRTSPANCSTRSPAPRPCRCTTAAAATP